MTTPPPSGFITGRDALTEVGRELHGERWTGEEDRAPVFFQAPGQELPSGSGARGAAGVHTVQDVAPQSGRPRAPDTAEYRASYEASKAAQQRWRSTADTLIRRLADGQYRAVVLDIHSGQMTPLPQAAWRQHDAERKLTKVLSYIPGTTESGRLLIEDFRAPPSVTPTAKAEADCRRWLVELMKASPTKTTAPKAALAEEAEQRFGVGRNGFRRAWDRAIDETGALGWRRKGPKGKSN